MPSHLRGEDWRKVSPVGSGVNVCGLPYRWSMVHRPPPSVSLVRCAAIASLIRADSVMALVRMMDQVPLTSLEGCRIR